MPGPKASCECGNCQRCRWRAAKRRFYDRHYRNNPEALQEIYRRDYDSHRAAAKRYYERNAAAIIAANSQRKSIKRGKLPQISDEELDRRALERWNPEWRR